LAARRQTPITGRDEAAAQQRGETLDVDGGAGAQGLLWSLLWDGVQDDAQKPAELPVFCRRLVEVCSVQPIFGQFRNGYPPRRLIPGCTIMQVRYESL
jgi:hypothetical protein